MKITPNVNLYMIQRLAVLIVLFVAVVAPAGLTAQISNPIPDKIQPANFTLILKDFIKLPSTSQTAPRARINMLREADDGSGRLFVCDLNGLMYSIKDGQWDVYLNLKGEFAKFINAPGKGTGFGAFAFHPDFRTNGIFYTSHAEEAGAATADFSPAEYDVIDLQWVVYEWTATDPSAKRFEGTRREILRADYPDILHGFQDITFNPTVMPGDPDYGMLYICVGEGGSSLNFLEGNLTYPESYLGTIFRIDPFGNNSANGAYGIPADNPFAGVDGAVEEIYVMGFRNPHRICWDPEGDHKMLIGDIGEMNIEEVNIGIKGNNYGWSQREGIFLYDRPSGRENVYPLPPDDSIFGFTYPVAMYDHDEGNAIVGGYVYRKNTIPELNGKYLFGDILNGRTFVVDADSLQLGRWIMPQELYLTDTLGNVINLQELENNGRADLRFGSDLSGNIYVLTKADGYVRTLHSPSVSSARNPVSHNLLKIFPNPADNHLFLKVTDDDYDIDAITITTQDGKTIMQPDALFSISSGIDISGIPDGAYLISVTRQNDILSAPLIIHH